jgi:hypothetical protein
MGGNWSGAGRADAAHGAATQAKSQINRPLSAGSANGVMGKDEGGGTECHPVCGVFFLGRFPGGVALLNRRLGGWDPPSGIEDDGPR